MKDINAMIVDALVFIKPHDIPSRPSSIIVPLSYVAFSIIVCRLRLQHRHLGPIEPLEFSNYKPSRICMVMVPSFLDVVNSGIPCYS